MIAVIEKGNHLSNQPFLAFPLHIGKVWERVVMFTEDSKYNPDVKDGDGIHKTGGFSLGLDADKNSLRFGHTYNKTINLFELYAYIHEDYKERWEKIASVRLNKEYVIRIKVTGILNGSIMVKWSIHEYLYDYYEEEWVVGNEIASFTGECDITYVPYGILRYYYFGGKAVAERRTSMIIKRV